MWNEPVQLCILYVPSFLYLWCMNERRNHGCKIKKLYFSPILFYFIFLSFTFWVSFLHRGWTKQLDSFIIYFFFFFFLSFLISYFDFYLGLHGCQQITGLCYCERGQEKPIGYWVLRKEWWGNRRLFCVLRRWPSTASNVATPTYLLLLFLLPNWAGLQLIHYQQADLFCTSNAKNEKLMDVYFLSF